MEWRMEGCVTAFWCLPLSFLSEAEGFLFKCIPQAIREMRHGKLLQMGVEEEVEETWECR